MEIKKIDWIIWGFKTSGMSLFFMMAFIFGFSGIRSYSTRETLGNVIVSMFSNIGFDAILIILTLTLFTSLGFLEYLKMRNRKG